MKKLIATLLIPAALAACRNNEQNIETLVSAQPSMEDTQRLDAERKAKLAEEQRLAEQKKIEAELEGVYHEQLPQLVEDFNVALNKARIEYSKENFEAKILPVSTPLSLSGNYDEGRSLGYTLKLLGEKKAGAYTLTIDVIDDEPIGGGSNESFITVAVRNGNAGIVRKYGIASLRSDMSGLVTNENFGEFGADFPADEYEDREIAISYDSVCKPDELSQQVIGPHDAMLRGWRRRVHEYCLSQGALSPKEAALKSLADKIFDYQGKVQHGVYRNIRVPGIPGMEE